MNDMSIEYLSTNKLMHQNRDVIALVYNNLDAILLLVRINRSFF